MGHTQQLRIRSAQIIRYATLNLSRILGRCCFVFVCCGMMMSFVPVERNIRDATSAMNGDKFVFR